jgi:hypothetical protein
MYLIDEYVSTQPGEPYRLLPYGKLVKNGRERLITPELASQFHLPHFKPPIKLGSHADETPAGGHIVGLEVRDDGLYAIPELVEKGAQALADGAYRYHSPEIIWDDAGFEDPKTGEIIRGPLIVGDALLHTPHLGEAAALYSIEPLPKEKVMSDETVQVPKTLWDKFTAWFDKRVEEPAPVPGTDPKDPPAPEVPEEFKAAVTERDQFKAELEQLKAKNVQIERLAAIQAEFNTTEFGMSYVELGKAEEAATMLAGMSEEARAWCMRNFKALSKQIDESKLLAEHGSAGNSDLPDDPRAKLDAVVRAKAVEAKVDYNAALQIIVKEQPDLFKAAYGKKE